MELVEYKIEYYEKDLSTWLGLGVKYKDLDMAKAMYNHHSKEDGDFRLIQVTTVITEDLLEEKQGSLFPKKSCRNCYWWIGNEAECKNSVYIQGENFICDSWIRIKKVKL